MEEIMLNRIQLIFLLMLQEATGVFCPDGVEALVGRNVMEGCLEVVFRLFKAKRLH
jgi:hypothetical protein